MTSALGTRVLVASRHVSRRYGALVIALGLLACWALTIVCGGAAMVPPHYFYIPILFAGIRFGAVGSLGTAVAAGVLSGPLMYADVATRTPQSVADWGARGLFFIVIGQALTAMTSIATAAREEELDDLRCARDLSSALDQGRLEVWFQPIVSLRTTGRITGAEALARLREPEGDVVLPGEFVPGAERNGMIRPLGDHVLRAACQEAARWRAQQLIDPCFTLSVNVSPRQLDSTDFVERVAAVLTETGLAPSMLQLEITETSLAQHRAQFVDAVHSLRRLGVRLALDDFGTGHSTLAEVQSLPIDVIKIDRQFVATMGSGGSVIAEHVVALARSLGLATVAEGVETSQQATLLGSLGCDSAQGYLYGRPVPPAQFTAWLLSESATHIGRHTPTVARPQPML
ncbi:MAG: putative bifunctional diguanylate cyclase/phosphodiesterase [Microthrixaceae bacterium]